MGWYISSDEKVHGPFDETVALEAFRDGRFPKNAHVRREDGGDWARASAVAVFAPAFVKKRRVRVNWWGVSLAVVALGVLGALGVGYARLDGRLRAEALTVTDIRHELEVANHPPDWVPASAVQKSCFSDRTTVTCTFTNLSPKSVVTCARGELQNKASPGVHLESVVICTGKLDPTSTRTVTAPWVGGFADDVCHKSFLGSEVLDWSKCDFNIEPADVPAMRRAASSSGT